MFRRSANSQSPPSPVKDEEDLVEDHHKHTGVSAPLSASNLTPRQRQELFRQGLLQIALKYSLLPIFDFFHARTGPKGCRVSGWMRFTYAIIFVYSRTLFALETGFMMDPLYGVIPYRITQEDMQDYEWTIFEWAPESRLLVYFVVYSNVLAGWGLLLGILPRLSAFWMFVMSHMLNNHNGILWDSEDNMFRLWVFFFLFMPLDHITVWDGFGGWWPSIGNFAATLWQRFALVVSKSEVLQKLPASIRQYCHQRLRLTELVDVERGTANAANPTRQEQSTSWPMWPFRLFQIYMCYIYLAAGLCKLNTKPWQDGTALWWLWYDGSFGRFFPSFVSEYFFNRMAIVKLQTWIALVIECGCMVTIWIPSLRWYTFLAVVALHIGIELALVMHAFEYLSVLGWVSFFVYPNDTLKNSTGTKSLSPAKDDETTVQSAGVTDGGSKVSRKTYRNGLVARILSPRNRKVLVESILVGVLLYFFTIDSVPRGEIVKVLPTRAGKTFKSFFFPNKETRQTSLIMGEYAGIHAGQWTVYRGIPPHSDYALTAVIQYNDGRPPTVWEEEDMYSHNDLWSMYQRERYYWSSTFYYYLSKEYVDDNQAIPFVATFAMHLAWKYADGHIQLQPQRDGGPPHMIIDANNPIKSISIMAHSATGKKYPKDVGLWESVPREWSYESNCNYVLTMSDLKNDFDVSELYEYNADGSFDKESGCDEMDDEDEKLHLEHGSFEGHKSTSPLHPYVEK
ncbi:hypothetical protein IV203_003789 [Nitzschia inconspicua]|uniref:HTTM-like domain-containing protein n=1 Tax=Nitzschia inconspicua TaxID=303405 RepID=A0A9K3PP84_9STRA|nr:hypothetical protein IV203_003789 [Nitzschia inconspicua]